MTSGEVKVARQLCDTHELIVEDIAKTIRVDRAVATLSRP